MARDLYELFGVDAILISCLTMNRSAQAVRNEMARYDFPVIQIDEAMMEAAIEHGGKILVVAIGVAILAQLSMTVFKFSYPNPIGSFGIPILTIGECGFSKAREVLMNL